MLSIYTVRLVIFVGLNFLGLGSSGDFISLFFRGISTLIIAKIQSFFVDTQSVRNPQKFEPH